MQTGHMDERTLGDVAREDPDSYEASVLRAQELVDSLEAQKRPKRRSLLFLWGHGDVTFHPEAFELGWTLARDDCETWFQVGFGFVSLTLSSLPDSYAIHFYSED